MRLTILGLCIGWALGFAFGFAGTYVVKEYWEGSLIYGIITACIGAVAGSVTGGVADVLAFLRLAFPNAAKWQEADYRELPRFPNPGSR